MSVLKVHKLPLIFLLLFSLSEVFTNIHEYLNKMSLIWINRIKKTLLTGFHVVSNLEVYNG